MKKEIISLNILLFDSETELPEADKNLLEHAHQAVERAYAPYSKFKVGAAVKLANGEIILGNNQENAAYPSGLCAERVATFYANSHYPNEKVVKIAIAAWSNGKFTKDVITPCGSCRQVLLETENRFDSSMRILMYAQDCVYIVNSIKDLLPLHFGDEKLKV